MDKPPLTDSEQSAIAAALRNVLSVLFGIEVLHVRVPSFLNQERCVIMIDTMPGPPVSENPVPQNVNTQKAVDL